ncbi:sugar isomerase domain-containing protein [Amycolatopsis sp. PS_44_ISF1]|uniref:sugar isomerase domain-containing protein n=1 Tax=Amycolatopsis sp. PS_44_ISF1 TaxID=2974917 RepID=UPI0028E02246|nr:sugar isomerase domain-containing protein [Amycolatopsis sp. PS_44_ISF1]MDT8913922.1 sugar isomerase domain-containing protein [Amycolatopsis sp. PS_44_ISF1]
MVSTTENWKSTADKLAAAEEANAGPLAAAAELVLGVIRSDALVFTAGAGHSLAAVAETFYRAGGLACVYPLYHPELLPLHGAQHSTQTERRTGLAEEVLAGRAPGPDDLLVVFSTSGVNPYPVELAAGARRRGASVLAVTSRLCVAAAPRRSATTLAEEGTVVLDSLVVPGDASHPAAAPRTAPLSTVVNAFLWNLVLTRVFDRGTAEGLDVPLWRSSNVEGGDEANAALLAKYGPRVPALR